MSYRTAREVRNVTSDTAGETDETPDNPRSSEETGDTSYSETNSTNSATSGRSDTSRIDGPGISDGMGDTATTQSGGKVLILQRSLLRMPFLREMAYVTGFVEEHQSVAY
ncbi:hypothetical protein IC229_20095 [Spirosoma sp. BT702]|uniref:Uncharacterized protein n=1 Tax=Spirosoma profusum TaxID=2771354 RepID=A0A927AP00_9BACT|nr:hypothetical protein [Spirosoma profusum]MBD2702959.1 hypothetical protein [Spirosoma profusum]